MHISYKCILTLQVGWGWADKIVSLGALAGIATSLLGSLLGQARIYVTLGRQYLLPPWLVSTCAAETVRLRFYVFNRFNSGSHVQYVTNQSP